MVAGTRRVLDMAGQLWIASLATARLFMFPLRFFFSWPQSSPSSLPISICITVCVPGVWDTNDGFPKSFLYCQSPFTYAQRSCESVTECRGRHEACTCRIWIEAAGRMSDRQQS